MQSRSLRVLMVILAVLAFGGMSGAAATESGSIVAKPTVEVSQPEASEVVPAGVPVAYVATGLNFPDALGGGPAAAVHDGPILLVRTDSIPASTATELTRLNPGKIVILGGTGVVSAGVEAALDAYTTGSVERLSGTDRYETAAAISADTFPAPQIAVFADRAVATTLIPLTTCTKYSDMLVTIDTPVAGTAVLHANVQLQVNHVTGTETTVLVGIGTAPDDCTHELGFDTYVLIPGSVASGQSFPTVPVSQVVELAPGVHNFYLTAWKSTGDGEIDFWFGGMDAVFYPNP